MFAFIVCCGAAIVFGRAIRFPEQRKRVIHTLTACAVAAASVVLSTPSALVLSKTLGRAALPLGLLWLFLVARTLWHIVSNNRAHALRGAALTLAITALGSEPLGRVMCAMLEAPYRADPFEEGTFDAVIVLGGGTQRAPHDAFELSSFGDRVVLGARLWHAGRTPLLVTTGAPVPGLSFSHDNTISTARIWRDLDVPPEAIVTVQGTRTTSEEAVGSARLIRERGWRRVGLVTSAWHMRRALGLFHRAGVEVVPLAADHQGTPTWEGLYSLIPVGFGAWLQHHAMWEWIGAAVGR